MKLKALLISWSFLGLLFLSSCKPIPPTPPLPIETIAILLFDSESNDVDAPDIMQDLVYRALKLSPYQIFDIKKTNEKLKELGFVDGGQLAAIDQSKLGRELGVHALLFGNVESFGYTNIGVYVARTVNLELQLIEVATGEGLWAGVGKGKTSKFAIDKEEIEKNFKEGLADQLVDKIFKSPLEHEAKLSVRKALRTLPGFRFQGFAEDDQTKEAIKKGTKGILKREIHKK